MNPYFFVTFTNVLPTDYSTRLVSVFQFPHLTVDALSKNDLLIMKCFAARMKDQPHVKALIRAGANVKYAESHIDGLVAKGIPGAEKALDF